MHAAAAAADTDALEALLHEDPELASAEGGPYRWQPILYLAYARHDPSISEEATVRSARLLLDHGADPDAGYLWHGFIPPFTALTGALGSGEGDQPRHPHGHALAETLLAAGADPNDGQALYNRQFGSDDSHLTLLFGHGLGRGDGGPWRARLGGRTDSPAELIRGQLEWAVTHDMRDRVRLLAEHGADLRAPFKPAPDRLVRWTPASVTPGSAPRRSAGPSTSASKLWPTTSARSPRQNDHRHKQMICASISLSVTESARELYGFELEPEVRDWLDSLSGRRRKFVGGHQAASGSADCGACFSGSLMRAGSAVRSPTVNRPVTLL